MNSLRFIDDPARHGFLNMAIDDMLACDAEPVDMPIVLRLYWWERPTLSCGFHQEIDARVDLEKCATYNVDLARRPTGGRELLHDGDLSFSITGPKGPDLSAIGFFQDASRVIMEGLKSIGIETSLMPRSKRSGNFNKGPCLAATAQFEISHNGKKLIPMAQRIYQNSILVHGSIPLRRSKIPTTSLLRMNDVEIMQRQINLTTTDLASLGIRENDINGLKYGLRKSFESVYQSVAADHRISELELSRAIVLSEKWKIKI